MDLYLSNIYCSLGVYYNIPIKNQIEMLFQKKKLPTKYDFSSDGEYITDFKEGSIYKDLLIKENPRRSNDIYSFTLNTDGISLCDKSNIQIWPQYLTINETDIEHRYSPDNTIICGKKNLFFK